jgi:hypothetical protein
MKICFPALFFTAFTVLSSCDNSRYIYTASPPNNPYFTEKGDSKVAAYYSASGDNGDARTGSASGWDLQGAYAIGNHWALAAGYLNRRERDTYNLGNNDYSTIDYKRNLFDLATGYFVTLDKKKEFIFNLYAGVGFGKFSFIDNTNDKGSFHNSSITKPYFQPSVNFMPSQNFRLSFGTRFSFVHYGNIQTSYTPYELENLSLNLIANRTISFIEPALNIQFGIRKYPWLKLDYTLSGTSHPFRGLIPKLDSRTSNVSIGLSFDFSRLGRNHSTSGR